jgi:hypothetical protein
MNKVAILNDVLRATFLGGRVLVTPAVQIPVHRGQPFRRIADSIPVIADSF